MNSEISDSPRTGRFVPIGGDEPAFVPAPLSPPGQWLPAALADLAEASSALGELAGFVGATDLADYLPGPRLLLAPLLNLEALASSRIEGTVTTLEEVLRARGGDRGDLAAGTLEVLNYLDALELGMEALSHMPLGLELVRQLHALLMRQVRGHDRTPGEFRQVQVYVGNRRLRQVSYVPPPSALLPELLADWESFLRREDDLPPLLKCGLLHAQLELIHPFLDGNGRVGRLVMSLYLVRQGLLPRPLLYLSGYLERQRAAYYACLQGLSRRGEWDAWLRFFLTGVADQSRRTLAACRNLIAVRGELRERLRAARATATALALLDLLFETPYTSVPAAAQRLGVTYPTARAALRALEVAGIACEYTGRRRNQRFQARPIIVAIQAAEGGAGEERLESIEG